MSNNPIDAIGRKTPVSPTPAGQESKKAEKPKNELDTQQFLHLLVKQLENQDPLNPMNSEEFAVQLAQFSQLDELIHIRKAVESGGTDSGAGGGAVGSMASYLGHEVVLSGEQTAIVENGRASNVLVDVPSGTQSLRIDLTDEKGAVVGRYTVEDIEAGRQVIGLEQFNIANGSYDIRVVSVDAEGKFVDLDSKITGTVDGFVLEPEPRLLVDGREVGLDEVVEVHRAG